MSKVGMYILVTLALQATAIAAPPRFVDVTAASGIRLRTPDQPRRSPPMPHAVAVEDFDGDGLFDIIIASFGAPHVRYYRNKGKLRFADVTKGSGLETFRGAGTGACVADFDRDGRLDLYLSSLREGPSRLFRGVGQGRFEDVTERAGVLVETSRSCAWSDVDGDGWVDLFVTRPHGPNRLFRNNGDGTFTDIAARAGVALADRRSLGCVFGDVDADGWDDLFVANYDSQISTLLINTGGGKFRDVTQRSGLARKASAVGCVFADVNNRGVLDLFVTTDSWLSGENYTEQQLLGRGHTVQPNALYANDGRGKFNPLRTKNAGLDGYKSLAHDAILEDLDHDGRIDIYVAVDAESGNRFATSKGGNPLWTRSTTGAWREVSKEWSVRHEANCVCIPAADFDNDGDLDLLLVNFYSNAVLYRNETNDKRWLRVKASGTTSNSDGIGARIKVFAVVGDRRNLVGMRQIQSGAGYGRCSPLEAHFGLGVSTADHYRVEVLFPGNRVPVVADSVKAGQRIVVNEDVSSNNNKSSAP